MEKLENIYYEKPNYKTIKNRTNKLLTNEELLKLGLTKKILTKTEYNYPLEYYQLGYGDNEIFLVAGTHGSEIITVDFITQLLEQINTFESFDPNTFKINIIPIQNPEGFDISSSNLTQIKEENFERFAYEYYLRYRTDSIITSAITSLNNFIDNLLKEDKIITSTHFLESLKHFIKTDKNWLRLEDKKAIPNIKIFNNLINQLSPTQNLNSLKIELLNICNITIAKLDKTNLNDNFLITFINTLKNGFASNEIWQTITNENQTKLYQQMFANQNQPISLENKKLTQDIINMYQTYNHPKGSIIGHDATGTGINLNANNPSNPGIISTKNNKIIYGPGVKNNIKNYFPGPLGTPCKDVYNFEYTKENKALFKLINESYNNGKYLMTILYHGTGGLIYYKPYEQLMNEEYEEFYNYNKEIAQIYNQATNYKILEESSTTGYGDLLRRTFPGVLLVELSKMGGNPIGPYGDKNNISTTINDNFTGIKNLLSHFQKNKKIKIKQKSKFNK